MTASELSGRDATRLLELGWTERTKRSYAAIATASGSDGLRETFGVDTSEATERRAD